MVEAWHRPTEAIIDLSAIKENIKLEKGLLKKPQQLFAVVKANAYGHGLIPVAFAAQAAGADGFCVAVIDEGLALRRAGITKPILILGVNPAATAPLLAANSLAVAVDSLEFLKQAAVSLHAQQLRLAVHLALDTGMSRIGFKTTDDLAAAVDFLRTHTKEFDFQGIFTHFATADAAEADYYQQQLKKFKQLLTVVDPLPTYVHVANSAASLWHQACGGNMVRFGVSMYGLNPSGHVRKLPAAFKPALSLVSELAAVREIQTGESVGYGKTYTAQQTEWIGTVPLGYADGWLRRMQGSKVLINGHSCEIVGRVCMDQIMVRLPQRLPVGTKVTLIGKDGQQQITAQQVADYAQTIHYEILCGISERVPRKYLD
ncbi:alanine racemase [Liquorilactobacillus ghanensis DSM 18630]|uniref:Alanine racemase n=1 Tax=Liquorilactobacillus ghanensis DSM 18630 TaxID=1423750 RepID=A0A0R1VYI5_9LACO|nr:alanine racemase [Liquorilactobacillus ghanensis]KRM08153.1 alanine racemase [Liquorilactobacillus ghanensis DSM 18630]